MRLWTIQPKTLYEKLKTVKIIHCDQTKSDLITEWGYSPAYDWLIEQMISKIGTPPEYVKYPIWAWHTVDWQHKKPDLRRREFRGYSEDQVCIEIEIPDSDVLLSDEVMWLYVLNNYYYGNSTCDQMFDTESKWFDSLSPDEQLAAKSKSWKKIFDVFPCGENRQDSAGQYIQATFWELKYDQIQLVRHFKGN
ncbi:MAG: DUF3841 domain-containing protein [Oscillospiraceae bacterium]|nr:DUF3841 domain-containing protein [Oscillospiraceae bacterium]